MIEVKVIADSITKSGIRGTTLQLKYPRIIHGEFLTHRSFARNSSSSRAIPVDTMNKQVFKEPYIPKVWGKNISGMQAGQELGKVKSCFATAIWKSTSLVALASSWLLKKLGVHKQWANRITEPWQYISVVVTSTEWNNFLELRDHKDAQPEIQELAKKVKAALVGSTPVSLEEDEWHLPYVSDKEKATLDIVTLLMISTARCARVSYLTHDNKYPSINNDVKLYERLVGSVPLHASPTEHQFRQAGVQRAGLNGNLQYGLIQYRKLLEKELEIEDLF